MRPTRNIFSFWLLAGTAAAAPLAPPLSLASVSAAPGVPFASAALLDGSHFAAPPPQVHGEVTVGLGFGRGFSERFAAGEFDYEDPARGISAGFGYEYSRTRFHGPPPACFTSAPWPPLALP